MHDPGGGVWVGLGIYGNCFSRNLWELFRLASASLVGVGWERCLGVWFEDFGEVCEAVIGSYRCLWWETLRKYSGSARRLWEYVKVSIGTGEVMPA